MNRVRRRPKVSKIVGNPTVVHENPSVNSRRPPNPESRSDSTSQMIYAFALRIYTIGYYSMQSSILFVNEVTHPRWSRRKELSNHASHALTGTTEPDREVNCTCQSMIDTYSRQAKYSMYSIHSRTHPTSHHNLANNRVEELAFEHFFVVVLLLLAGDQVVNELIKDLA